MFTTQERHVGSNPTTSTTRIPAIVGGVALLLLNVADIITTKMVLSIAGSVEANPIAQRLMDSGLDVGFKVGVSLVVILLCALRKEISPAYLAAVWFVVGIYAFIPLSNYLVYHSLTHL